MRKNTRQKSSSSLQKSIISYIPKSKRANKDANKDAKEMSSDDIEDIENFDQSDNSENTEVETEQVFLTDTNRKNI